MPAVYAAAGIIVTMFVYYGIVSFINDLYEFFKQIRATPVAAH